MIRPPLKLYNFFRGRSRSRSKPKSSPKSTPITITNPDSRPRSQSADIPPVPSSSTSHIRHTSLGDYPPPLIIPIASPSTNNKPLTRSQSRPLSAVTTGTHSTITSLVTPQMMSRSKGKGKNKVGEGDSYLDMGEASASTSRPPSPPTRAASNSVESSYPSPPISPPPSDPSSSLSAATSKHPTSTRMRLHNLFGIPLTSPRRSSFGSGSTVPSSPPPRHNHTYGDLNLNSPSQPAQTKHTVRRATSPSPPSSKEKDLKRRSATAPASWLTPRFFSSSGSTIDRSIAGSPPPYPHIAHLATVNPDSTSTLQTQTTHSNSHSHSDHRGINSSIHAVPPVPPLPSLPIINHTPPTPQKSAGQQRRSVASPRSSSALVHHGRNRSLVVVGEGCLIGYEDTENTKEAEREPRRGRWSPMFFGSGGSRDVSREKGKQKETDAATEMEREREKSRAKLTGTSTSRVPSPVGGAPSVGDRTTPLGNGSTLNVPWSGRSKHGSFNFERPVSNSSRGGVSITAPSSRKARDREKKDGKLERTVSFSNTHTTLRTRSHYQHDPSTSPRSRWRGFSPLDESHPKKTLAISPIPPVPHHPGPGSVVQSSSWGRTTSTAKRSYKPLGLSHGSFPFEPAVPPISTTHPTHSEFGVIRSDDSGYAESSSNNSPKLFSASTNGIERRTDKSRSLDLNIGLSWAPTKVKQEAVMSSSYGREKREREKEEARKRFESAVSDVFRNVLGESGYATFTKCEWNSFSWHFG